MVVSLRVSARRTRSRRNGSPVRGAAFIRSSRTGPRAATPSARTAAPSACPASGSLRSTAGGA